MGAAAARCSLPLETDNNDSEGSESSQCSECSDQNSECSESSDVDCQCEHDREASADVTVPMPCEERPASSETSVAQRAARLLADEDTASIALARALQQTENDPLEGIWLGGQHGALMENLAELSIVEVDCRYFHGKRFHDRCARNDQELARNAAVLLSLAAEIHMARQQDKVVYVHCAAGRNRGPAVLTAYLLRFVPCVHSLEDAFARVRSVRPHANTKNNTFMVELAQICRAHGKAL